MTLSEIRNEIWQQLGEPSDLDPTTDVQYNGGPLLTWVANEGQRQVASWKDVQGGRVVRMPNLYGEMMFKTVLYSFTLEDQSAAGDDEVILPASASSDDDRYNGWLVTVGSETAFIVDYVGASRTATVHTDWSAAPVATDTATLSKRYMLLAPSTEPWVADNIQLPSESTLARTEGNFLEVLKIEDIEQQVELQRSGRVEDNIGNFLTTGDPQQYYRKGNRIIFDVAPSAARWYRMEYYRLPTEMANASDPPDIPEQYHYGICLWGFWWGFRRAGDNAAAYSVKMDWNDFMRRTVALADIRDDRVSDAGRLRRS